MFFCLPPTRPLHYLCITICAPRLLPALAQFQIAVLKLAINTYVFDGGTSDVSKALDQLFCERIQPRLSRHLPDEPNVFRRKGPYLEPVCDVLMDNEETMRRLFDHIAAMTAPPSSPHKGGQSPSKSPNRKHKNCPAVPALSVESWMCAVKTYKILADDLSEATALRVFVRIHSNHIL
jgi:hypothetical protein